MTAPTAPELALLRTQPQRTRLYLSIFQPQTVFAAQVNDGSAAKGDQVITFDTVTTGNYLAIGAGMTLYVGTSAGARDKGAIFVVRADSTTITVGENSHINWADGDYLTVVNFHQIWPVYPSYVQDAENITVYKVYDTAYVDQNEDLGSFVVMGPNYAGFIDQSTGTAQVYWDSSESENVIGTTGSTYRWSFEGGTPTGSTAITPGWVTYDTPGHYRTLLRIDTPGLNADIGVRHVSIYERPGEGDNTPILSWGMRDFGGSRDEGGYTARLWVKENISSVVDGALVIIFADDWYGTTQQSIGGNFPTREKTVFVGYILDGSIDYNYQDSTVEFDVGSPSEIMKLGEAFSVSVEDSTDPSSDAVTKGVDPWFYLVGLTTKTALYHYFRWHSSVYTLMDIRYVGDEFNIQFFDADRSSLYDAADTFMKSTIDGKVCCDRQGALYFEIDDGAINNASSSLPANMFIDNHDWMGTPTISERFTPDVSYLEIGGVSYDGAGSFSALIGCAPGDTPAYRGKNLKLTGYAVSSQGQLNTMVGNIWENMNSTYPEFNLDLVGNFRNLDIAPQEIVTTTLLAGDTFRGLSWEQKAFTPTAMRWTYDGEAGTFLPNVTLEEVTQGNDGQTISIPVAPPGGGYEQPPIQLPPPIPPIPGIDIGGLGYSVFFSPALGGYDGTSTPQHWGSTLSITKPGIEMSSGGFVWGATSAPNGATQADIYPLVRNVNGASSPTVATTFEGNGYHVGSTGSDEYDSASGDFTYVASQLNWLTSHTITLPVLDGDFILWSVTLADGSDLLVIGAFCVFT